MLLTAAEMRASEEAAFARGVSAESLMDRAGSALARAVRQFFPSPGHVVAVCGKGNNAGDALVALAELARCGWSFEVETVFPETEFSELAAKKLRELPPSPARKPDPTVTVLLDGLLGIGASGSPREPVAGAIERLNKRRSTEHAFVFAVDIPSGLDADTGEPGTPCVFADFTVTMGHAKIGLLADSATDHVGRLVVAELPELEAPAGACDDTLITPTTLREVLPPPSFDSHKGMWGRVGILAGSRGFLGAAQMCSTAALRAGGGLVTLYALPKSYELLARSCPPEIMVKPVESYREVLEDKFDAVAIGPGIGSGQEETIVAIVKQLLIPAVVDADALNELSRRPGFWHRFSGPRLFTPHPGEMQRLYHPARHLKRREAATQFASEHPLTLLLKGARTVIADREHPVAYNTTGNPGMGSGGMGDVLTGVCAALMARKHPPYDAARIGAWVCGRAAERSIFLKGGSPESLTASDVLDELGGAFNDLRLGVL